MAKDDRSKRMLLTDGARLLRLRHQRHLTCYVLVHMTDESRHSHRHHSSDKKKKSSKKSSKHSSDRRSRAFSMLVYAAPAMLLW